MANIVEKTFNINYGETKNYFSTTGSMNLDSSLISWSAFLLYQGNSGDAIMNNAGKEILYPTTTCHPIRLDLQFNEVASNANDSKIYFIIDDVIVYQTDVATTSYGQHINIAQNNITYSAVLNSTRNSTIRLRMTASQNGLFNRFIIKDGFIKMYYQQWDLTAQKIGDGWGTILAPGRVYDGENINYSFLTAEGCTFHGWYSDVNHTNLVSNSYIYNVTASQDLVLYPYVTKDTWALENVYSKTNFQLGSNTPGWFKPAHIWYKTLNGWEAQNNTNNLNTENNYRYSNNFIDIINLANTSESYNFYYYPWSHGVLYIKNSNNYILTNLQGAINLSFKYMQDGIVVQHDGTYYTGSQTVNISFKNLTDENWSTMTLTISFTTFNRDIQFKDLDGNLYKTQLICNQPFTVTTPSGSEYNGFSGWREVYCGTPTGRILQLNESYWDVGWNNEIYYEPVFSE